MQLARKKLLEEDEDEDEDEDDDDGDADNESVDSNRSDSETKCVPSCDSERKSESNSHD